MFLCEKEDCKSPKVGPRTKPTLVPVFTRAAVYSVMKREEGAEKLTSGTTSGFETVKEMRLCPNCAGLKPPTPLSDAANAVLLAAVLRVRGPLHTKGTDHRRGCKDYLEDCKQCKAYMEVAAGIPLDRLSGALEDPKARPLHTTFAARVFEGINKRADHNTKRAARDLQAAYTWLAPWSKAGGKL